MTAKQLFNSMPNSKAAKIVQRMRDQRCYERQYIVGLLKINYIIGNDVRI